MGSVAGIVHRMDVPIEVLREEESIWGRRC